MANHTLLKELQQKIDYQFKDENLLFTALTHSSYANEHKLHKIHHNERLEFLGDAVLEVVSSDFLFKNFPDMAEGQMSKKRASLVCEPTLAYCARQIGLGKYLMLGKGEDMGGGRQGVHAGVGHGAMAALPLDLDLKVIRCRSADAGR